MEHRISRKRPKTVWVWIGVGVIIVVCLFLIKTFVIGSYRIPTTSMEKTIHHGSMVLVNKLRNRPLKRGDILVFHFPIGDTVIDLPDYRSLQPFYDVIRELGHGNADSGRQIVLADPSTYPLTIRPIFKQDANLKRCVAVAGDTFQMRDERVFVNGHPQAMPGQAETYFHLVTKGQPLDEEIMKAQYDLDISNSDEFRSLGPANEFDILATWNVRDQMLKDGFARSISPDIDSSSEGVFPNDQLHHWTRDNYGPIWIPKVGTSIQLTPLNYPIYERVIRTYEGNKLDMRNGKVYINDREASSYTFKMNYYWMIGDNLHGSQDSRYWGFVPEDHLIGKVSEVL